MNHRELWQVILGELELALSKASFVTWFSQTSLATFEEGRAIINVPNTFVKAWLEKKYHPTILKTLQNISGQIVKEVLYKVDDSKFLENQTLVNARVPERVAGSADIKPKIKNRFGLNEKYTFKNFVVGKRK